MRQLNRLNQFQRLWQQSRGAPQHTSVAAMAACCFCSERHLRTLLTQWQQAGWLQWRGEAGRGKRGTLLFLHSPDQLRQQLLRQQLDAGLSAQAMQLLQLAPDGLFNLVQPLMGGQWHKDAPVLRIPYYRPLETIAPLQITGRAEQYLAHQLFSGLTRFHHDQLEGDLAHHWQCDAQGTLWYFWLRPQLCWHNGEPLVADQLAAQFAAILRHPVAHYLLADVETVDAPHPLTLRIRLRQPDFWLAHRLAHLLCLLPHPLDARLGSGAWKLAHFSADLVRIESHARWHFQLPLMQAVEYWITPQLFDSALGTSCRHPVQISIAQPDELTLLRPVGHSISLGFCYLVCHPHPGFSAAQARKLFALIQRSGVVGQLPLDEELITPSQELLPGWPVPQIADEPVALPATLTLHYHLPVELHEMAHALQQLLQQQGCNLHVVFHPVKSWRDGELPDDADLVMGDRLIGDAPVFTLASWLQMDPLWQPLRQNSKIAGQLETIQRLPQEADRAAAVQTLFQQLMQEGMLLPLFNYHYQISAPPGVEGIALNSLGWFDFNRAWIPPPGWPADPVQEQRETLP